MITDDPILLQLPLINTSAGSTFTSSHHGTSRGVLIAECSCIPNLGGAGSGELVHAGVGRVPDVTRRGLLVVDPWDVRVVHRVVRHVGPRLGPLPRPVGNPRHHLGGVHVAHDGDLVSLGLDVHRMHSLHSLHRPPHLPLAPFAVYLHLDLHCLRMAEAKTYITFKQRNAQKRDACENTGGRKCIRT